jgi:hypothetical protein
MKKNATDGLMTATDTVEGRVDDSGITVDDELSQVRNDSIPPYEDETYLQRLYETCDTFSEMSDKIELDVAGETVRRYMIEADVHSPTRYNDTVDGDAESPETESNDEETEADGSTSTDSVHIKDNCTNADSSPSTDVSADSADQMSVGTDHNEQRHTPRPDAVDNITETETLSIPDEQLVTDGAGLPSELEVDDLIDAVVGARTVYEVQRRLGIEYRQTRDLLDQLDILDLVLRRVSGGPDPDCGVSYEAIATRIEQYTQT